MKCHKYEYKTTVIRRTVIDPDGSLRGATEEELQLAGMKPALDIVELGFSFAGDRARPLRRKTNSA
jgi:hypothetical protein